MSDRPARPKPERLTETERDALLATGRTVHRKRQVGTETPTSDKSKKQAQDWRALAYASKGSWEDELATELVAQGNAARAAKRAAGIPDPVPQPPDRLIYITDELIAERGAFIAKFLGDFGHRRVRARRMS